MDSQKKKSFIIPALIIAAAIIVGSWMIVQSNKTEAEKAAKQRRELADDQEFYNILNLRK